MTSSNPLAAHFRQPAIYLKLPSQGAYWPEGSLVLPANGELPVYPMTTKDEITLRTPDALMNGSGVVEVIKSCIPAIQDPWIMPSVDVDACIIAIRIASYGPDMDITSTCPNCKHVNDHTIDLTQALENIRMPDFSELVTNNELSIKLKPQPYFNVNRANMIEYEEQRVLMVLSQPDLTDADKEAALADITNKLITLNIENLTSSTEYVLAAGVKVTDPTYIAEFYEKSSSVLVRDVQAALKTIADSSGLEAYNTECTECQTKYKTEVTFDYSRFFVVGS